MDDRCEFLQDCPTARYFAQGAWRSMRYQHCERDYRLCSRRTLITEGFKVPDYLLPWDPIPEHYRVQKP